MMKDFSKCIHHRFKILNGELPTQIAISEGSCIVGWRDLTEEELFEQNATTYCVLLNEHDPKCNLCGRVEIGE